MPEDEYLSHPECKDCFVRTLAGLETGTAQVLAQKDQLIAVLRDALQRLGERHSQLLAETARTYRQREKHE